MGVGGTISFSTPLEHFADRLAFLFYFLNFQDTFDIRICLAKSTKFVIDFQTAEETDLHVIDIPLNFTVMQGGMIHGLAFWFEVGFLGSE